MRGEARTRIAAPPEAVYALVSDVTRMGKWSPETKRASWVGGATGPAVGARFRGINRSGPFVWWTTPRVTDVEPGRVFEFRTSNTVWRYELTPTDDGGTEVVESFVAEHVPLVFRELHKRTNRQGILVKGMKQTLARLKAAAESST